MRYLKESVKAEYAHQVGILIYIWHREQGFRVSIVPFFVLALCFNSGFGPGLIYAGAVATLELLIYAVCRAYLVERYTITRGRFAFLLAVNFLATLTVLYPALDFLQVDSVASVAFGTLWIAGVALYTASTYSSIPVLYWSNFIPSLVALPFGTYLLYLRADSPGLQLPWLMAMIGSFVYVYNCVQVLVRQQETLKKLNLARKEAEERAVELEFLSQSDKLSGLANRLAFDQKLGALLKDMEKPVHRIAVFLIDLDHFKPINDSYGHDVGDAVLREIGTRLRRFCHTRGFAARLGGDEFAVVMTDIRSDGAAMEAGIGLFAVLNTPMVIAGETLEISGSIGIARASDAQRNLSELCKFADQAMFSIKRDPEVSVALFDPEKLPARATLQDKAALMSALQCRQIKPYYQPKIDMLNGSIYGLEALARWEKPDGTIAMPGQFLPKMEELGMLNALTFSILRTVLQDMTTWKAQGLDPGRVSVNLDEASLTNKSNIDDLIFLLRSHDEVIDHLIFEVTEDVFLARAGGLVQRSIEKFVAMGVRVSLDDFGTGFASFQHLRQLTLHELKIDTSFVTTMGTDPTSRVIVEGFLSIASGLGIDVVAEGVETEEQRNILLSRGCHIGQGFLYSPAVTYDRTTTLLGASRLQEGGAHLI